LHRLQQSFQGSIHSGGAHQYGTTAALLKHLESDGAGGIGGQIVRG
jgi:hypothetical protein